MEYNIKEIKQGIKLHTIQTDKFKTNLMAIFLTTSLNRNDVTKNALISSILRRGSKNMPTQEEISKQMESMYGAIFDCGLDKTGDNQVIKFYIESINDKYLPNNKENLLKSTVEKLLEIVFDPYIENESFKEEYLEQEKEYIKRRIAGKIDDKARYSLDRCIEEMYKGKPFGLYKFGYIKDLANINGKDLYKYYQNLINNCKIDIFISGDLENGTEELVEKNNNIEKLPKREPKFIRPSIEKKEKQEEKIVLESMDVLQGKLIVGLDVCIENEQEQYATILYNSILGGSANSKMFQNVREKAHLAYIANSMYLRNKNNIFINCGIEIENYEKTLELIRKQIDDMKKGDFTEEIIENCKKGIIDALQTIRDEQDVELTYHFGQELTSKYVTIEEYQKRIESIKKEDIINVAKKVEYNTVYFLKN